MNKKLLILIIATINGFIYAQDTSLILKQDEPNCEKCHYCAQPTKKNPCLRECPRTHPATFSELKDQVPEIITLDILSELYVPVMFSHQFHAEMADISGGCTICHHYNPSGSILNCKNCHQVTTKRNDLSKPSLRGAYHRQCLGCHREWDHETKCAVCHALKSSMIKSDLHIDSTDIIGVAHPDIPVPGKIIYETDSDQGALITFYHDEHSSLFGLLCVDCHQKESCKKCHDRTRSILMEQINLEQPVKLKKIKEQHHKDCESCHSETPCRYCHASVEKPRFSHTARTGWELNRFHKNLSCQNCHPNIKSIKPIKRDCINCHHGWNVNNFDHSITGLILDENHLEHECTECHGEKSYSEVPSCENCHDEEISFPKQKPGRFAR